MYAVLLASCLSLLNVDGHWVVILFCCSWSRVPEGEVAFFSAKPWDRRNRADLIESATPHHDAPVVGSYRVSSPLRLIVLAAMSEDYTTAPQHLQVPVVLCSWIVLICRADSDLCCKILSGYKKGNKNHQLGSIRLESCKASKPFVQKCHLSFLSNEFIKGNFMQFTIILEKPFLYHNYFQNYSIYKSPTGLEVVVTCWISVLSYNYKILQILTLQIWYKSEHWSLFTSIQVNTKLQSSNTSNNPSTTKASRSVR